jgi:hypothetical protein
MCPVVSFHLRRGRIAAGPIHSRSSIDFSISAASKADRSIDYVVANREECGWHGQSYGLAVFRLTTSSTLVGCSTGMSEGLALLRTLTTMVALCSHIAGTLGP